MAFIAAAAEIKFRKIAAAAGRGGGSMLRTTCWPLLLLAAMAFMLVFVRSIDLQLLAQRLSVERLPHLRDSIFATQPFLFLVLNSMIFAVLAPSGLFKECCSPSPDDDLPSSPPCSSRSMTASSSPSSSSTSSSSSNDSSTSSASSMIYSSASSTSTIYIDELESSTDAANTLEKEAPIPAPEPDPDPTPSVAAAPVEAPTPAITSTSTDSSPIQGARKSARPSNVSPPKSRVKRVRKMQKSTSPGKTVVLVTDDIAEQSREHQKDFPGDLTDSLKDDDFKQFIDSFIAHRRQQIFLQEREYEAATAVGSRA